MQSSTGNRRADWYVVHVLAAITLVMLATGLGLNILQLVRGGISLEFPSPGSSTEIVLVASVMLSVAALFGFWIRMLADFFRHRPPTNSVSWGFALLFFNFAAALVYFWRYWRPRHAR